MRLTRLYEAEDIKTCEHMQGELESISSHSQLNEDAQQRILSLTMKKAGFEMNENITVNKAKRFSRRFIVLMAAAVIAVTGAVGAGAVYIAKRRSSVEALLGEEKAVALDSRGLIDEKHFETDKYDMTIDTVLCDGQSVLLTLEAVPKDENMPLEELEEDITGRCFSIDCNWEKEDVMKKQDNMLVDGAMKTDIDYGERAVRVLWQGKMEKPFDKLFLPLAVNVMNQTHDGQDIIGDIVLELKQNVISRDYVNANGEKVRVSEIAITAEHLSAGVTSENIEPLFEYDDGSTAYAPQVSFSADPCSDDDTEFDNAYIDMFTVVEIINIKAVTIGTQRYEEVT